MISDVAALYVDPRGPYPKLVEHWWDEQRDARTYAGPWPVVAHPPCGPWGRLSQFCTRQDAALGLVAMGQVRRFGGVLEHPEFSRLFREVDAPHPGELPDLFGGVTVDVDQVAWGHSCRKRTWLYLVGIRSAAGRRRGGKPTHVISTSRRARPNGLPELTRKWERAITPVAFAEWLISLAQTARRPT